MGHAYQGGPPIDRWQANVALGGTMGSTVCNTPGKIGYVTAGAAARALRATGGSNHSGSVYRCQCGEWHVTKMAKGEHRG